MKNKQTIKAVLREIGTYKVLLVLSSALTLFSVYFSLHKTILAGKAVDEIVGKNQVNFEALGEVFYHLILSIIITAILQWLVSVINNFIVMGTVKKIRNKAFSRLMKMPLSYIDTIPSGDIVSRIVSDADQLADGLLMGFSQLLSGITTIVFTLVFMVYLNPIVSIFVAILTPMSLLVARFISKKTHNMFKLQAEARAKETSYIDEHITNQKTVKAFTREEKCNEEFAVINEELRSTTLQSVFYSSLVNPSTRFVNNIVYAAVAAVGAIQVIVNHITIGGLVSFLRYSSEYTKPFNEVSSVITELQHAFVCAGRILNLISAPIECTESDAIEITSLSGDVKIRDLNFSYTKTKKLIENLNLDVKKGSRVAIVGPTGCGKTTLINLLMRFYDVDSGSISVDGIDIKRATRQSLRKNYGMVLQDTWIKNTSVRDNIAFAKPDASDEEIVRAAKLAHCHSFIIKLKNGYDTMISDDGMLSHGQKQLICIARVMLNPPPMLILDEATSSIDTRTELKIRDAFGELMKGKTSFIVAHRLSTVKNADIILVMNKGKVVEQGTHDELMLKKGFYHTLYSSGINN